VASSPDKPSSRERRRRWRRAVQLPLLSGKASALALVACLGLTAVLIPMALRLTPWIEYEIVLVVWWLIWAVTLTVVLHRRQRITHDYELRPPRKWFEWKSLGEWFRILDLGGLDVPASDSLGMACLVVVVAIIAIPVLLVLAWVVIEVAIPLVAFVTYLVIRGMLARVANDWHGCQGSWARSALWGAIWAAVYTLPLALIVWSVHRIHLWHAAHYL
jgi:hypothetical protein